MAFGEIVNDLVSLLAALKSPSPDWEAVNEHVPTLTIDTVVPDTVQIDVSAGVKVTVKPEFALTDAVNDESPYVFEAIDEKVMD